MPTRAEDAKDFKRQSEEAIGSLDSEDYDIRLKAKNFLVSHGARVVPQLVERLKLSANGSDERNRLFDVLEEVGPDAAAAASVVLEAVLQSEWLPDAERTLKAIGPHADYLMPGLLQ